MTTQKPNPGDTRPSPAGRRSPGMTQPSPRARQISDTQPGATRVIRPTRDVPATLPKHSPPPPPRLQTLMRLIPFGATLVLIFIAAAFGGNLSGQRTMAASATSQSRAYLEQQYQLALLDIEQGNLELARQRFQFIFTQDQSFTSAADHWVELSLLMNSTATVTPPAATPSATPTEDPRPKEELFAQAALFVAASQWDQALEALSNLRRVDPGYRVIEADGMIYLSLRNRGVDKILRRGELESGIYDFSLAEQFGPLDAEAIVYRGWARLYLTGNSFWVAYPDIAAGYYGQVASAAPNLRDESGLTAFYRYFASLVQYADQLAAAQDWCAAADQYQIALRAANNSEVAATASAVQENCIALTPSLTPTFTRTPTLAATTAFTATIAAATSTETPTGAPVENTPTPTATSPAPSATNTAAPATETPAPSATTVPTETPTPEGTP